MAPAVRTALESGTRGAQLAFFGGSFTAVPRPYMISLLEAARPFVEDGSVSGIRISTRPDSVGDEVLDILEDYGVEAVELGATLLKDAPAAVRRCEECRKLLEEGESLSKALGETGLLPASACRLLTLGIRGGSGDEVMEEIAQRLSEDAQLALENKVSKVEPALVLVTSVLVGAILLSVMLPLMNIMTAIG